MKRDCQCPRARHTHGTLGAYHSDHCRCFPCRIAKHRATEAYKTVGYWHEAELVPKAGTLRRLQALMRVGWSSRQIGELVGLTEQHVQNLRNGKHPRVSLRIADAVSDAYDELWDKRPNTPSAKAQRTKAEKFGYLPPLAWDDDEIDDPDATPHTPGNGTWDLAPCGTPAAARRHHRHGEPLDEACRNAQSRQSAQRKDVA